MLTPTALTKPTMTALETKRSADPSRARPATSMTAPVRTLSVNSAAAGSRDPWTAGTSATMTAIAPVAWTAMNVELVASAPPRVPKR